jgi:phage tail P2-like protein
MSEKSWQLNRPIYLRLPNESGAYQGNEIVDAITTPWDEQLVDIKNTLLNFNNDFINPDTARVDALDWLAQLSGFTGEYWDTNWTAAIKRELIKNSHTKIWSHKGTVMLLQYLLDLFGLDAVVYAENVWFIGITAIGSPVGGRTLYYAIKLFIPGAENRQFYTRNSKEWKFIERLNRLYMPCWCGSIPTNGNFIHYEKFIIGVSAVGDPIWSGSINKNPIITVNFGSGIAINSSMQIGANFSIGSGFDTRIIRPIIANFGIGNSTNTTKVITSNFGIGSGFDAAKVITSNFGIGSGFNSSKVIVTDFGIGGGLSSSITIVADFGIGNADNTTKVILTNFGIGSGFDL